VRYQGLTQRRGALGRRRLALAIVPLMAACAVGEPAPEQTLDGSERMVQRLSELANGLDRRQSPFANEARVAALSARGPDAGLQGEMTYRGQLSEQLIYSGRFAEAVDSLTSLLRQIDAQGGRVPPEFRQVIADLESMALLKWEEQEVCVVASEVSRCLVPALDDAPRGADAPGRLAATRFEALLEADPEDLQSRWLLNVSYMLLGEYPEGVPARWLIPLGSFEDEHDIGRFVDVAAALGVDDVGHAGGAIMDDFDRDGDLDVVTSGWLLEDQMRYYESDGAGGYSDRTEEAGLTGMVGGLNMKHADFDNDGYLDILVLRGAWLSFGQPNSLLRNRGDGTFTDVTASAGLLDAFSTQTADWGDFDNDGWVDIFVGNEASPGRRDPSQLFRNNGDGTFSDVSREMQLDVVGFVKGVTWGDVDNDGDLDLYVSFLGAPNRLLRNDVTEGGKRLFTDVGAEAGVTEPTTSFPVWFWDYNNDGWLDLYVSGYRAQVADIAAEILGRPSNGESPRLYLNKGDGTFTDVTNDVNLQRVQYVMGSNYGDLDSDGYPDFYVATGDPAYESVMANRMFRNDVGTRFQEVTTSGGFGHLQKGHAVSFGDADNDGDQDILLNMGGATQADKARNALFVNPGHGNHWITLRLEGGRTNRAAIGVRVRVSVLEDGAERIIHERVTGGGSFGANSLQLEIGLGAADAVTAVEVDWPASGESQRFENVGIDAVYRVVEGALGMDRIDAPPFTLGGSGAGN
jgi:VCBS repeat protein/ASPIC/UnbV protein